MADAGTTIERLKKRSEFLACARAPSCAKRRMREAARRVLPDFGRPGFDYVIIARGGVTTRPWVRLLDDVKSALIRLAADRGAPEPELGAAISSDGT